MKKLLLLLLPFLVFFQSCQEKVKNPELGVDEFKDHISYLASEELKGRFPGTEGDKKAARYIRDDFKSNHLNLLAENGMQKFSVVTGNKVSPDNTLIYKDMEGEQFKDFVPFPFSGSSKVTHSVAFAGYGFDVSTKEFTWNDYEKINPIEKWVFIIRGMPEIGQNRRFFMGHKSDRAKALLAQRKGALGVIMVSPPNKFPDDELVDPKLKRGNLTIPVLHIKRSMANRILESHNRTLEEIINKTSSNQKPVNFSINDSLTANIDIEPKRVQTQNVVAEINIDTETDTNDYIVIGGHYDHLGMGGPGSSSREPDTTAVHYGADDNASGIAAMLELAEKLKSMEDSLNNNYLFIAFGAEELGLLGSKYFTNNPLIDLERVKAMINIDMVGRLRDNNELRVGGTGTAKRSEDILNLINESYNFDLGFSPEGYGPSDHSSFYSKEIPVFFFSTGPHLDYHTPKDNPSAINYKGVQKISKFVFLLARETGKDNRKMAFQETRANGDKRKHREDLKVTLGIMPDFAGIEDRGLRADMVIKGKTADRAGMKDGDIITAINGKKVKDVYDYMYRLSNLKPGQNITIEIIRDDKKKVLMVQL
jgi:hypothetical protein